MLFTLSIMGFTTVLAGAFGAHALKSVVTNDALDWWQTGTLYMMFHTLSGICSILTFNSIRIFKHPTLYFILGNIFFAGSLYTMTLTSIKALGVLTPIGGAFYLIGWGFFTLYIYRNLKLTP
jgi:Uncharacterized small membrane protein